LSFALGEAFQFDWSDEGLMVGGAFAPSAFDLIEAQKRPDEIKL